MQPNYIKMLLNIDFIMSIYCVISKHYSQQNIYIIWDLLRCGLLNTLLKIYLEVDFQGALFAWDWVLVLKVCQSAHSHGISKRGYGI